jgi:hypothetical protein
MKVIGKIIVLSGLSLGMDISVVATSSTRDGKTAALMGKVQKSCSGRKVKECSQVRPKDTCLYAAVARGTMHLPARIR